jgi:protein-S-isoprenylcysteine O-methyltransferase Ste14
MKGLLRGAKMDWRTDFEVLREKVPWFGKTWGKVILLASLILPFLALLALFWWLDRLLPYGALIGQFVVSIMLCAICYYGMRHLIYDIRAECKKTHVLPNWLMPLTFAFVFAPWCALPIHPFMVSGNALLPLWVAIPLGLLIIVFASLMYWSTMRAGFSLAHGLSIYLLFPEEGTRVSKDIYSYLRHPGYAMLIHTALGFALLRNNLLALLTALIYVIPNLLEMKLEDRELIERFGEEHRRYISETPAIFPRLEDIGGFAKLLLFGGKE